MGSPCSFRCRLAFLRGTPRVEPTSGDRTFSFDSWLRFVKKNVPSSESWPLSSVALGVEKLKKRYVPEAGIAFTENISPVAGNLKW